MNIHISVHSSKQYATKGYLNNAFCKEPILFLIGGWMDQWIGGHIDILKISSIVKQLIVGNYHQNSGTFMQRHN